ncbi:hypothetical protein B7463_g12159, partial [Scytalidium lignicola]
MTEQDKETSPSRRGDIELSNRHEVTSHSIIQRDDAPEELFEYKQSNETGQGTQVTAEKESAAGPTEELRDEHTEEPTEEPAEQKAYSSFTLWQKRSIILAATLGAFFSPFSAQIYFPALNTLSEELHVSPSKINLTITTYMILQGIAPSFVGAFSDNAGRRPAYIICFVIYIAADIALALQSNYVALLILRMVQSAGSSGTVALANAVVADCVTSAERGMYIGITSLTNILAPSIGPILGGIISQYAGWKWIFGFLAILATVFIILFVLFFPETCRSIVGDGTIPPPKWNRSIKNYIEERAKQPDYSERNARAAKRRISFPNPLGTLIVLTQKSEGCVLFFAGIVYAGFYAIVSGLPSEFKDIYGYDDLKIGLCYLPMAGGSLLAAWTQGKFIDWSYRWEAKRLGMEVIKSSQQDLSKFPIEKARLQVALPVLLLCSIFTVAYGWILHSRTTVAGPLIMLFLLGYTLIASTQSVNILIVDINPGKAGTVTAAFNLIRCLLGAGSTALIHPMTNAMGYGWTFTFIGLLYIALSPLLFIVMRWGPSWRKQSVERNAKIAREKEKKDEEGRG